MGLLALVITLGIAMLGSWYFLMATPNTKTVTVESSAPLTVTEPETLSRAESYTEAARDVKALVENQAAQTMQAGEEPTPLTGPPTTGDKNAPTIVDKKVFFGFGVPAQKRTIDTIVLHSSYDAAGSDPYSVAGVIAEWKGYSVAPHYLIDRKGTMYRLVDDANIAYHAGTSKMPDGRTNVNDFSIGVEILNTKEDSYTSSEYTAVNNLIAYLKEKYGIKFVVGHSDIAPGRKTDPWNFDWKKLK